jgi:hypothetical protein
MQVILIERLKAFPAFHMPSELFNPFEYTVIGLDILIKVDDLLIYVDN